MLTKALSLILFLFVSSAGFGGQALITNNVRRNMTIPNVAPFNAVGDFRLTARIKVGLCSAGSTTYGNIIRSKGLLDIGCTFANATTLHVFARPGILSFGSLEANTEYLFRVQRSGTTVTARAWKYDGTQAASVTGSFSSSGSVNMATVGESSFLIENNPGFEVAWVRWYNTLVPEENGAPTDQIGSTSGLIANWEFEGNVAAGAGGMNLSPSPGATECAGSSCYAQSAVYAPVIQIVASNTLAGDTVVLNGSGSFTYDGSSLSQFVWQQVSGPVSAVFSSRRSPMITLSGLVTGEYGIRLTVKDSSGMSATIIDHVSVQNVDAQGFPILPTNKRGRTLAVSFRLQDVAGAASVRLTVKKPDGSTLSPKICVSSPCNIQVDDRQKSHLLQIEYRNAQGAVLAVGGWQPLAVAQKQPVNPVKNNPIGGFYYKVWPLNDANANGPAAKQLTREWLANKGYDFSGGSVLVRSYNPEANQPVYSDMAAVYPDELYDVRDISNVHGYTAENLYLHSQINYTAANGHKWTISDKFDYAEGTNGVVLANGSSFVDKSTAAYDNVTADVSITDKILIGAADPFDEVNFVLSRVALGSTVSWQYWNGSAWTTLALASDGTVNSGQMLGRNGEVRFLPPSDWALSLQANGSSPKWWIRIVVSGGTTPIATSIKGDDWMTGTQARGWDPVHTNRINVGLGSLEYNPNPPAGATARFKHQSRLLGIWASNNFFLNPADIQKGERTAARYVVERPKVLSLLAGGWNGIFVDNGHAKPTISSPSNWQNFTEAAGLDYENEDIELFKAIRDYMVSLYPNYKIAVNSDHWEVAKHADFAYHEAYKQIINAPQMGYETTALGISYPDSSYRSIHSAMIAPGAMCGSSLCNPRNTVVWIAVWDVNETEWVDGSTVIPWDRANRTPMAVLASYYIYANPNLRLFYLVDTAFVYRALDHFYYHETTPSWITNSSLAANLSGATKTLSGDFADFVSGTTVRMGINGEYVRWNKVNNTQISTTEIITESYEPGVSLFEVKTGRLSQQALPPLARIKQWGFYFPAMNIEIGEPDVNGHNGGRWNMFWKAPCTNAGVSSGCTNQSGNLNGVQRRDFTKAVVLFTSPYNIGAKSYLLNQYGATINFAAESMCGTGVSPCTMYPLLANGTTGPGISSIALRTAEGAVLMREPVE